MWKFFHFQFFPNFYWLYTKLKTLAYLQQVTSAHWYQQASVFVDGKRGTELLDYLMLLVSDVQLSYKKRLLNIDETQSLSDIDVL
jgi:hypothetical protein